MNSSQLGRIRIALQMRSWDLGTDGEDLEAGPDNDYPGPVMVLWTEEMRFGDWA